MTTKFTIHNNDGVARVSLVIEKVALLDGGGKMQLTPFVLEPHKNKDFIIGDGIYFVIREEKNTEVFTE